MSNAVAFNPNDIHFPGLAAHTECAKLIIQSGIRHVVYYGDKYHDNMEFVVSRKLMDMAGVSYRCDSDMCESNFPFPAAPELPSTILGTRILVKGNSMA